MFEMKNGRSLRRRRARRPFSCERLEARVLLAAVLVNDINDNPNRQFESPSRRHDTLTEASPAQTTWQIANSITTDPAQHDDHLTAIDQLLGDVVFLSTLDIWTGQ